MAKLTLQYWKDDGWFVGRLKQIPSVISQGKTLAELQGNILDAYKLVLSDTPKIKRPTKSKQILVPA